MGSYRLATIYVNHCSRTPSTKSQCIAAESHLEVAVSLVQTPPCARQAHHLWLQDTLTIYTLKGEVQMRQRKNLNFQSKFDATQLLIRKLFKLFDHHF